ncbi:MAG: DUF4013 domain-containing protein [Anaerolineae bacterium]|nr:DUF4013 domain-containing protein [Anaerolineae bacterium]
MDFVSALRIVFDDPQWVSKLTMAAIVTAFSILLTPLLIGLAGWAVLLGYQLALIANLRAGIQHPLPRWIDLSEYFNNGSQAFIALVLYMLPLILFGCCIASLSFLSNGDLSSTVMLGILCLSPFLLIYLAFALLLHTLGMGRFLDDPRLGAFFDVGGMLSLLRARSDVTLRYILNVILLSALFGVLNGIPCLGTLVYLGLQGPVSGALAGLFVHEMLDTQKPKAKRA